MTDPIVSVVIPSYNGVAFIGDDNPDNMATIGQIGRVRVLGRLPRLPRLTPAMLSAAMRDNFDPKDFAA